MRKKYTKVYFERYAALTIAQYLNIDIACIIQEDCPDIQIEEYGYGIEVTQA